MSDRDPDQPETETPDNPRRRLLLGGLAAAAGAAAIGTADAEAKPAARRRPSSPVSDAALRANIDTLVVIYAENRSFNNLFAEFPGLQHPLSAVSPERSAQRDRDGSLLKTLPKIPEGLVPKKQVVEHREYLIGPDDLNPAQYAVRAVDAGRRSAAARSGDARSGPCLLQQPVADQRRPQ
jgi:phospholipase C